MQLGMIGLGRMGANLIRRLALDGHECVANDVSPEAVSAMRGEGFVGADTVADLVAALDTPRTIWVMVPAAVVEPVLTDLVPLLDPGDIVIDGGNSNYRDAIRRAETLARDDIAFVDIGTSGGVYGLARGFCLMVGGTDEAVAHLAPVLDSLAPGAHTAERTADLPEALVPGEVGWLHCGPAGAGHFVKMVHNGIEYGMMAALAEGLGVLDAAGMGRNDRSADAETAPLADTFAYQYDFDLGAIAQVWRRGSVISSWLVDLTAHALAVDPDLAAFDGRVSDSGEGRWTVHAAVDLGIPAPTITAALFARFASRDRDAFADRVLSAMRSEFGGHHEKKAS
jgi:6-phosphogluconate dehydrogenase